MRRPTRRPAREVVGLGWVGGWLVGGEVRGGRAWGGDDCYSGWVGGWGVCVTAVGRNDDRGQRGAGACCQQRQLEKGQLQQCQLVALAVQSLASSLWVACGHYCSSGMWERPVMWPLCL